jgi:hypothetical protein
MSRPSPCAWLTPRPIGARSRPAKSAELGLAPLQHFGITEIGLASRDIVREAIQFFRDVAQYLLDVRLDGYICQSSGMVGLRMIIV